MQILVLDTFDNWGHMVSKVDKPVLASHCNDAELNLTVHQLKKLSYIKHLKTT